MRGCEYGTVQYSNSTVLLFSSVSRVHLVVQRNQELSIPVFVLTEYYDQQIRGRTFGTHVTNETCIRSVHRNN